MVTLFGKVMEPGANEASLEEVDLRREGQALRSVAS